MHRFAVDPGSPDISPVSFHPVLWICAAAVFAVIVLQSVIYLRAIRKAAGSVVESQLGLTPAGNHSPRFAADAELAVVNGTGASLTVRLDHLGK